MLHAGFPVVLDACGLANPDVCYLFLHLAEPPRLYLPGGRRRSSMRSTGPRPSSSRGCSRRTVTQELRKCGRPVGDDVGVECRPANRIIIRMGVCVFVASGLNFDVDAYLKRSPFKPATVFRKGQVPSLGNPEGSPRPDSGLVVIIGMDDQPGTGALVPVAFRFLLANEEEFQVMKEAGVDNHLLDFQVFQQTPTPVADYLPPELLIAMASHGMGMMISVIALPNT